MTRRLQVRIMATFVLILLVFVGVFVYQKVINAAPLVPSQNAFIKGVSYTQSDNLAIFEVRWKQDMKKASVKNPDNFYIEHVVPKNGKWLTIMNGKKCNISFIQHTLDPRDPDHKAKVTQLSVYVSPKESKDDFYRIRVRNVESREGEKMGPVEYGVTQITNFAKFTKK